MANWRLVVVMAAADPFRQCQVHHWPDVLAEAVHTEAVHTAALAERTEAGRIEADPEDTAGHARSQPEVAAAHIPAEVDAHTLVDHIGRTAAHRAAGTIREPPPRVGRRENCTDSWHFF